MRRPTPPIHFHLWHCPRWRGGGGDRIGGGLGEEAGSCPHRAWLLCSSISQRALPASRERLNEARAVWRTKAAGQHTSLWSVPALFRPQTQTFLFHLALASLGRAPFFLSICPRQWSHLQSSVRCMVCQSLEGRGFKAKAVGLRVFQVPSEEIDTHPFRPFDWAKTPQLHPAH